MGMKIALDMFFSLPREVKLQNVLLGAWTNILGQHAVAPPEFVLYIYAWNVDSVQSPIGLNSFLGIKNLIYHRLHRNLFWTKANCYFRKFLLDRLLKP